MIALGMLAQEIFGTPTIASGFACTPTTPAGLNVVVAGGRLYSLQEVDPLQYSTLPADTTDLVVKQGILLAASTLSCPAPATSGQSVNYLIEAAFEEIDTNAVVLPYYNAINPAQPFSGPNNNGNANYTTRQDTVQLQVKAGTPATTGTQTTPAPDTGFVGLGVVTVAYGQTAITSGNITAYAGAPLLGGSLLQALQGNAFTYAADAGAANAYAASYAPAIATLVDGMTLEFQAAHANTGASTFSPNGITAAPIVGSAHVALQGNEIIAGSKCIVMWKASIASWILVDSTGGSPQVPNATQPNHAVAYEQMNGKAGHVRGGGTPTSGSVTTFTQGPLTFVAPNNGVVYAVQSVNIGTNAIQPGSQNNTITIAGSTSGSASDSDNTVGPMSNHITKSVVAGETVTITGTLVSNGAVGTWANNGISMSYMFTPSN